MSLENESPENMHSDLMSPDQLSPEKRSDSPDYKWTFKPGTNWGFVFLFMSHQWDEGGGSIFSCVSWEGFGQEHSEWVITFVAASFLKSNSISTWQPRFTPSSHSPFFSYSLFTLTLFLFLFYLFVHFHPFVNRQLLLDSKLSDCWSLWRTQNI